MKKIFKPVALTHKGSSIFKVNHPKKFGQLPIPLQDRQLQQVLEFSWKMTFGHDGEHRKSRSGGSEIRSDLMVFRDVFRGKLGEMAFHTYCQQRSEVETLSEIDFSCSPQGIWDCADFIINGAHHIAVKTTKDFGNILFLEQKDWHADLHTGKAIYQPNQSNAEKNYGIYDYFFLCRVKSNIDSLIHHLSSVQESILLHDLQRQLFDKMRRAKPHLDIAGYISNSDLFQIIQSNDFVLAKDTYVGKSARPQDADNYYIQSGCMRQPRPMGSNPVKRIA